MMEYHSFRMSMLNVVMTVSAIVISILKEWKCKLNLKEIHYTWEPMILTES